MSRLTVVFVSLAFASCGAQGDMGMMRPMPPDLNPSLSQIADAQTRCYQLRDLFCARFVDCMISQGQFPGTRREEGFRTCRDGFSTSLDCGKAVAVTQDYSRCISELTVLSCTVLAPEQGDGQTPASCEGVILHR